MYALVFISMLASPVEVIDYGRFESIIDCFDAREAVLLEHTVDYGDYFPAGMQAVCINMGEKVSRM